MLTTEMMKETGDPELTGGEHIETRRMKKNIVVLFQDAVCKKYQSICLYLAFSLKTCP